MKPVDLNPMWFQEFRVDINDKYYPIKSRYQRILTGFLVIIKDMAADEAKHD